MKQHKYKASGWHTLTDKQTGGENLPGTEQMGCSEVRSNQGTPGFLALVTQGHRSWWRLRGRTRPGGGEHRGDADELGFASSLQGLRVF